MPPIIYHIAGGVFFLPGAALLAIAVVMRAVTHRRWVSIAGIIVMILGLATIATSATALPWWFYFTWSVAAIAWMLPRANKKVARVILVVCTVSAAGWESWHQLLRPLPRVR